MIFFLKKSLQKLLKLEFVNIYLMCQERAFRKMQIAVAFLWFFLSLFLTSRNINFPLLFDNN